MVPGLMQQRLIQKNGIQMTHRRFTLLGSKENRSIKARWVIRSIQSERFLLIPFRYIFPVTLEIIPTSSKCGTPPEMRKGEISNEKDVEVCDIMPAQPLLSQKLLVSCLVKMNIVNKLVIIASHC
jgi:hypothetical protein